jgi:hypothetical protein
VAILRIASEDVPQSQPSIEMCLKGMQPRCVCKKCM